MVVLPTSWSSPLSLLALGIFAMSFALGVNMSGINNYLAGGAAGQFRVTPNQLGLLEAVRETSGLLTVFFAAMAASLVAPRLGAFALIVMGVGMAMLAPAPNLLIVGLAGFLWGAGFHLIGPVSNTIVLALAERGKEGHALGRLAAVQALGQPAGKAAVALLAGLLGIRGLFVVAGVVAVLGGLVLLLLPTDLVGTRKMTLLLRWRYARYYALMLLDGGRKQVFITFAVFLLVRNYHYDVRAVAVLMVVNSLITALFAPVVGRWIDRFSEKPVLLTNYSALILVFLGYALIPNPYVMMVLYALDNLFFTSNTALTVYLRRLGPSDEVRPSLSMGVSFNHVFSVAVPLVGGVLWAMFGYQVVFICGAVLVALSLFVASGIDSKRRGPALIPA